MKLQSFEKTGLQFVDVSNNSGLRVVFCNLGASIYSIRLDNYVLTRNVKDSNNFKDPNIFNGKTIGRVSNRMRGHSFYISNERYVMEPNEGENVLHGGINGLSNCYFEVKTNLLNDKAEIIYTYLSKHLEGGYPGNLTVEVKYVVLSDSNELDVFYSASCDMDTVIGFTNHSYFTLGCKSIKGLSLGTVSSNYLQTNSENLLAVGKKEITPVLDFRTPKSITKDIDDNSLHIGRFNGYDHFFYLDNKGLDKVALTLSNKKIKMDVYTDFEGVQVYTFGFDCGHELYPECEPIFNSVAIEPSDSFEKLHLLKKDSLYKRTIRYIFIYKE